MRSLTFTAWLVMCLLVPYLGAQPPDIVWAQTFGGMEKEWGQSVQQTTDGGYIVVGSTYSYGSGGSDIYLIKTDSNGDSLWTKTYGENYLDKGYSVIQTIDGGYAIAGYLGMDACLIKTDAAGEAIWIRKYNYGSYDRLYCVEPTVDGGYILTGSTRLSGTNQTDIYLVKTDSSGLLEWEITLGDTSCDFGYSVQQITSGGYIVTGAWVDITNYYTSTFLLQTDANGNTIWIRTYGGDLWHRGHSVLQNDDGGFTVAGLTEIEYLDGQDIYLLRTDSNGDLLWMKTYGGQYVSSPNAVSVQSTTDGGFIVVGTADVNYGEGIYLVRTDYAGDTLWTKTIDSIDADIGHSVQQTADGGYIVVGESANLFPYDDDIHLIKIASETGIEITPPDNFPSVALDIISLSPFSSNLSITYSIPEQADVSLVVYDVSGRLIENLVNTQMQSGIHSEIWRPSQNIPNGCYLIALNTCGHQIVLKCLRLN